MRKVQNVTRLFLLLSMLISGGVYADGLSSLRAFMLGSKSGEAQFQQVVEDKNGKRIQTASGSMLFVRPGRFRWNYQKPYEQLIVGDGSRFWLYDVDLNQVTVKKLDTALGSSPAALLAGNNEIEKNFDLRNLGRTSGMEWVSAKPKTHDTNFEKILLGFGDNGDLAAMELHDTFGQITVLNFTKFRRNPQLDRNLFIFSPPKGADILGEE